MKLRPLSIMMTAVLFAACNSDVAPDDSEKAVQAEGVSTGDKAKPSPADPLLVGADPQLAALIKADQKALDAKMASGVDTEAPAATEETAEAEASGRTYAWHGATDQIFVNKDGNYAWGRAAIQTAYDNGTATYLRAYIALHCYIASAGVWLPHACSMLPPGDPPFLTLQIYDSPSEAYSWNESFTVANSGSDGFYSRYGKWHASGCHTYHAWFTPMDIGLRKHYFLGYLVAVGTPGYKPASDC